jgi:hypothetical protein
MAEIQRTKIKYANFIAGITFIGAIIIFASYFICQQINSTSQELITQKNELIALQNREKLSSELSSEAKTVEKEILTIENSLPNNDTIINFINDLENLADTNNSKITVHFTEKPQVDPQIGNSVLVFNIDFEGQNNTSLVSFIKGLNQLPYFIKIYQINENIDQSGSVKANLKLGVFVNENF